MLAIALISGALAGDLAWRWDQGPVRYHAETLITTPGGYLYLAKQNKDVRVSQTQVVMDVTCTPTAKKKGWDLACHVDKATFAGMASNTKDQPWVDKIMAEYGPILEAGSVQMSMGTDGRVQDLELLGVPKLDDRQALIEEDLRQLTRRTLSPLDLQMPDDGVDPGKPWKQKGTPLSVELLGALGVSGGLNLQHQSTKHDGSVTTFTTSGDGNLGQNLGFSSAAGNDYEQSDIIHEHLTGEGRWDGSHGQLAWRQTSLQGDSIGANIAPSWFDKYQQVAWVARWNADGSIEGKDGPVKDEQAPTPASP